MQPSFNELIDVIHSTKLWILIWSLATDLDGLQQAQMNYRLKLELSQTRKVESEWMLLWIMDVAEFFHAVQNVTQW